MFVVWAIGSLPLRLLDPLFDKYRLRKMAREDWSTARRHCTWPIAANCVSEVRADPAYVPLLIQVLEEEPATAESSCPEFPNADSHQTVLDVLRELGAEARAAIPALRRLLARSSDEKLKSQIRSTLRLLAG